MPRYAAFLRGVMPVNAKMSDRPVFMTLIEKTFGKEGTTRTWDTVAKVAR
jgi:uncharacterized protein (DUF1697 family)